MPRLAQIKIATDVLRMVLDLPEHLRIVEVIQSTEDVGHCFAIVVDGPLCPEWKEGKPIPELILRFRRVDTAECELEAISGLDT